MVTLGTLNSRMKDFYDIWPLSRQFDFEGASLTEAVRLTFNQRGTAMPDEIEAFTDAFAEAKQTQWQAFHRRLGQDHLPASFRVVVSALSPFLIPVSKHLSTGGDVPAHWIALGPWR